MGLAASQARLLTLTSRQHSIEGEAQRLMANKLRLSNDSDTAYTKYIDALDNTFIKTLQTNNDGSAGWIDGSINNLMRYNTDQNTFGNIFYVQDMASGQLYMPEDICNVYNEISETEGNIRDFVEHFEGIKYSQVDKNAEILEQYNRYVALGYNTILADTYEESEQIYKQYKTFLEIANERINPAKQALKSIPQKSAEGLYITSSVDGDIATEYTNAINILKTSNNYKTLYTKDERNLLEGAVMMFEAMSPLCYKAESESNDYFTYSLAYNKQKSYAEIDGKEYAVDNSSISRNSMMQMVLNGGTQNWSAERAVKIDYKKDTYCPNPIDTDFSKEHPIYKEYESEILKNSYYGFLKVTNTFDYANNDNFEIKHNNIMEKKDISVSKNIYEDIVFSVNDFTGNAKQLLSKLSTSYSNIGEAINGIINNVINQPNEAEEYLSSIGKTKSDISHYEEFRIARAEFQNYTPDFVWVANDEDRAEYYEEIFNAIQKAGGCIKADKTQANSPTWVSNMIKNSQVILTMWDEEEKILSKTSSALNVNIREVTDNNYIEQVSQEYEDTLAEINAKDTKFDKRLSILETERNAITNEIESLKNIENANVETYFKVFM